MKHRFFAMALAGAVTVGVLAGCGGSDSSSAAPAGSAAAGSASEPAGSKTVTVITKALNSDYWHEVQAGGIIAGQELGYDIRVLGPNDEANTQEEMNQILDAANYSDALVIAPNDPNSLESTIADIHASGMPIVIIDSAVPNPDAYDVFTGTSNYDAGVILGEYIAEQQPSAKVGIIRGLTGSDTHDQRCKGLQDALSDNGCEVVDVQPADSDRAKGVTVAENLMQTTPDIDAFVATNDEMALGAYEAVAAAGKTEQCKVYSFDASTGALDSLQAGELTACGAQQPIQMGYDGVYYASKLINGEDVEKENTTDFVVLTKETAPEEQEKVDEVLVQAGLK